MTKTRVIEAAIEVFKREDFATAFGLPGAAIKIIGDIDPVLARQVEGTSHMADGYTCTNSGNIGLCIRTSGPAGTDMITGLYSAFANTIPILCTTGQVPGARMHKEDVQAVDISHNAAPVTKWATTLLHRGPYP